MYRITFRTPGGHLGLSSIPEDDFLCEVESKASLHGEAWAWGEQDDDGCRPYVGKAVCDLSSARVHWFPAAPDLRIFWKE